MSYEGQDCIFVDMHEVWREISYMVTLQWEWSKYYIDIYQLIPFKQKAPTSRQFNTLTLRIPQEGVKSDPRFATDSKTMTILKRQGKNS